MLAILVALLGILVLPLGAAAPPPNPGDELVYYLDETIDWYRRVSALDQSAVGSQELLFRDATRYTSLQVLKLGFKFARADAALIAPSASGPTTGPSSDRTRNLTQAAAQATQRVTQIQTELDQIARELPNAPPDTATQLTARRDMLTAELDLAKARQETLQQFSGFMAAREEHANGANLAAKIDDLERSVPEAQEDQQNASAGKAAATGGAVAPQQGFRPESAGIIGLVSEMFSLNQRMNQVKALANQANALSVENQKLLAPIRAELQQAIRRGDALSATQPSTQPAALEAQRRELEALAERFKLLAAAGVPLGEQDVMLGAARANLLQWHGALNQQFDGALRYLAIRAGSIVVAVLVLLGISQLWRRATYRYVTDARRRVQFLLLRRVVIGVLILVVIIAGIVTEFGSLATFAGLITAGIAVALQSVILSGAAYFFFIGRYGVRVGDRVTISGVTGDVIDTGLFRLYLMELAGAGHDLNATGRIVVFSNSVLFQSNPLFKQIPGADFTWHEVAMTLAPDTDYQLAEKRLLNAVESVYSEYRDEIERQYTSLKGSMHFTLPPLKPEGRLRFVDTGLELVVRYPVPVRRSGQIDDRITRKLLETIDEEPKLKLVPSGTPRIQSADGGH